MAAVGIFRAVFLAQNAVFGKIARYNGANRPLGSTIRLGHRIETDAIFVVHLRQLTETWKCLGSSSLRYFGKNALSISNPILLFPKHDACLCKSC